MGRAQRGSLACRSAFRRCTTGNACVRSCMCRSGESRSLVNNTPAARPSLPLDGAMRQSRDVKMFRTATAQKQSAFMSVSLMNEHSPFPLTPGKMVHSSGCFIDISHPSQRRNKVGARAAGEEKAHVRVSVPLQSGGEDRCGHL